MRKMKRKKLIWVLNLITIVVTFLLTSCGNSIESRAGRWQATSEFGEIAFIIDDTGTNITEIIFGLECDSVIISGWVADTSRVTNISDDIDETTTKFRLESDPEFIPDWGVSEIRGITIIGGEINAKNIIVTPVSNEPILDWELKFNDNGTSASGNLRILGQYPCESELTATNLGPEFLEIEDNASHLVFQTYDNKSYDMSDYLDQVVIINYWASWSQPSETEIFEVQRIWEEYRDQGVFVFGVNYLDSDVDAKSFIEDNGITFSVGPYKNPDIVSGSTFRVTGAPETYILDKNGNLIEILIGPSDYERLSKIINELLVY